MHLQFGSSSLACSKSRARSISPLKPPHRGDEQFRSNKQDQYFQGECGRINAGDGQYSQVTAGNKQAVPQDDADRCASDKPQRTCA
jgi:hypothetical protein